MTFHSRLARADDIPVLQTLMERAIEVNQRPFLTAAEIDSSRAIMGLDRQLIADGTYFVVEDESGQIVGCGGWSRRNTLYGGDSTHDRDASLLDPAVDAARVRAMYTDPDHTRRGIGRIILELCESAAAAEGFTRLQLASTLSGEPLYTAYGFRATEHVVDASGGAPVPLIRMERPVDRPRESPFSPD
jgi:GNAT superfamily N-acetyltransferase